MKIKNLGILALVFTILLSTLSVSAVFAAENTESAAFASVDFSTYKNPGTGSNASLSLFSGSPESYYGTDYNSSAFGTNVWLNYYDGNNWTKGTMSYIFGLNTTMHYLQIRPYGSNKDSSAMTGIHRDFAAPISVANDKTYYIKFKAKMEDNTSANVTEAPNQIRLGLIKSSQGVPSRNSGYEVDIFGGLKLNSADSTYRAQVSLDQGVTTATGTTAYSLGTTYNFLMRLDIDADDDDALRMKVYEDGATEPANWEVTTTGELGTEITLNRLCMDTYDNTNILDVWTIDIDAYDTALLDSVVPQIDAKFANFKYSEAYAVEETIKTLPLGMIRTSYEAKLAALKEANNTAFLREDFNYTPTNATGKSWSTYGGEYYNTYINTIGTGGEGWSGAWRINWQNQNLESGATNTRFQYTGTDTYLMLYNGTGQNSKAYRFFASPISMGTEAEYYFVFDAELGDNNKDKYSIIDARFELGADGIVFGYAGMKYVEDGLYAQLNAGGTTSYGCKKYATTDGIIYRFVVKLEVEANSTTMKMKVFPKDGKEPAQWELIKTTTTDSSATLKYLDFYVPANSTVGVYDLWAEKYLNDNLTASKTLAADIANGTVTTEAEVKEAITAGYAQNEYLAALNRNTAPILGSDISYDESTKTASLKLHNSRGTAAEAQPIIALYSGNELVGATVGTEVSLTANTRDQDVSVTYDGGDVTYDTVKVFIWNNMNDLSPVLGVWTFTVTQ